MSQRTPLSTLALPIDDVLGDIEHALVSNTTAILVAPPGAGKTTRVPLALLDAPWREGRRILVLEPRRLAARAAADRMADLIGEKTGERIGLRARLASRVGDDTIIEVITEGVFTRMIIDDPELSGVAAVLFDEFHERSLDADFGLALARDAQAALRPDLRILVMSATLDTEHLQRKIGPCPIIKSDGRAFPVETRYAGRPSGRLEDKVVDVVARAIRSEQGSILVFLPGQGEIVRVAERLRDRDLGDTIEILPLYGTLPPVEQDRAIRPATGAGARRVILATAIAETSLTIEGVRIVIDSGMARVPRYDADAGVMRLETVRVSRASANQRRGRAGRTEPGLCIRLWEEPETDGLLPFAEPEIFASDMSSVVLDGAAWGALNVADLPWIDGPRAGMVKAARDGLTALGALDGDGRLSEAGRNIRKLALPPRLAHMVLSAARLGLAGEAADIAAVIVERGIGGHDVDLDTRLARFKGDRSRRASDMRRLAQGWAQAALRLTGAARGGETPTTTSAESLALAYPERIAKARGQGQFLLANGRAGHMDPASPLATSPFLVVGEIQGKAAASRITLAAACDAATFARLAARAAVVSDDITFDTAAMAVRARTSRRLGAIVLAEAPRALTAGDGAAEVLARGVLDAGVYRLPWSRDQSQLRNRLSFMLRAGLDVPDVSDAALAIETGWLTPYIARRTRLSDITADDLGQALNALVPWEVRQRLDREVPTHFIAPTGNAHMLDYESEGAPVLAIRVQELFGLKTHPTVADGRVPMTLHLLSPARRPIQITRDLPGFWAGSWQAVRSDMRGRYPKHVWPDNPADATPTARAKPRGT